MADDDPRSAAAATVTKGAFSFPENTRDLFSLFLDPDIDAARQQLLNRVDRGEFVTGRQAGTPGAFDMTPAVQTIQRAAVNIEALTVQANRNQRKRRVNRNNG